MCGLFGAISTVLIEKEIDALFDLGIISSFRGTDSTGLVVGHKNKHHGNYYTWMKEVEQSPVYLRDPNIQRAVRNKEKSHLIMGHCRSATVGNVTKANAHPFAISGKDKKVHLLGMHNGTINGFGNKSTNFTDSEDLYQRILEKGLNKALEEARYGAWALTYVDLDHDTFNVIRNDDRPLYFMYNKKRSFMLYASERRMLDFVKDGTDLEFTSPEWVEPFILHTFKAGESLQYMRKEKVDLPKVETFSYRPEKDAPWVNQKEIDEDIEKIFPNLVKQVANQLGEPTVFPRLVAEKTPHMPIVEGSGKGARILKYTGFESLLHPSEAREKLTQGCIECKKVTPISIGNTVNWLNKDEYICNDCKKLNAGFYQDYLMDSGVKDFVVGRPVYLTLEEAKNYGKKANDKDEVTCH